MGQALYRKYRSKSLKEIIGQEHITKTLEQALAGGRISHAYLMTGPRGVGKTSIARILAHEINGLPYTDDSAHMDIIEIDAASNSGVEDIRDLRDKVYVAPTSAKYKVYIIDEAHMLSTQAFNALLKTLEEPPAHVVFILATTHVHKLPETIVSRTQRFTFKPVEASKVIAHLKDIAKKEKIAVSDEALALLAEHGQGSFRDTISLLDQASSHGRILELSDVEEMLGIPPASAIRDIVATLSQQPNPAELMQRLTKLYDQGYQAAAIATQLSQALRKELLADNLTLSASEALQLLAELIEVPAAHSPERLLEISLLKLAHIPSLTSQPLAAPITKQDFAPNSKKEVEADARLEDVMTGEEPETPAAPVGKKSEVVIEPELTEPLEIIAAGDVLDISSWPQVLGALKLKHNTLYGVVRMAQPRFTEDGTLELAFAFAFHQKRISETKNRELITKIIKEVTNQNIIINCIVDKAANPQHTGKAAAVTPSPAKSGDLSTISNIFGGGELLKS